MYQYSKDNLPKPLRKNNNVYPTRNSNIPIVPVHQSTIFNSSFMVKCTTELLKLPNAIKTKNSIKTFMRHLKVRLLR